MTPVDVVLATLYVAALCSMPIITGFFTGMTLVGYGCYHGLIALGTWITNLF